MDHANRPLGRCCSRGRPRAWGHAILTVILGAAAVVLLVATVVLTLRAFASPLPQGPICKLTPLLVSVAAGRGVAGVPCSDGVFGGVQCGREVVDGGEGGGGFVGVVGGVSGGGADAVG